MASTDPPPAPPEILGSLDSDNDSIVSQPEQAGDLLPHLGATIDESDTDTATDRDSAANTPSAATTFESLLGSPLASGMSFTAPTDPEGQARRIKELEQQLADEREKGRIRGVKATRTPRLAETIFKDPEADDRFSMLAKLTAFRGAPGLAGKVLAHGGTKNVLTYIDPGPHPRGSKTGPGWENAPSLNFERVLERVARKHARVALTVDYVREVAAEIEHTVDKRFNSAHARVHRAINSIAWMALLQEVGLERARELKGAIRWWLLRDGDDETTVPEAPDDVVASASEDFKDI